MRSKKRHCTLPGILTLAVMLVFSLPRPIVAQAAGADTVVRLARELLGRPYAHLGDDPRTGFSCIGLVHYLFGRIGIDVPYGLVPAYSAGRHVLRSSLRPGDLVFFRDTVWRGLSHVALYIGDGRIIGADNASTGVELTRLSAPYWRRHYLGATRPLFSTVFTIPTRLTLPARQAAAPHPQSRLIVLSTVQIYSGPGTFYPRIARVGAHTILQATRGQARWMRVRYTSSLGDLFGWIDRSGSIRTFTIRSAAR